jgi:tetratricopeptide (TPR) repeat protein
VGEVEREELPEEQKARQTLSALIEEAEKPQPEEARLLRSKFVQVLLLLRRGERDESIALLQNMLHNAYPPFDGAAQLFSEFGLGLRRLGLIRLALAAHKRAWEYAPKDERILFNIARSYHDLNLLTDAKEFLEKALAVAPDFASAKQFLAFLDTRTQKNV